MELNRNFSEFIASCAAHDVRFLIVGGYAVAAHGHPRFTKDLDVWVWVDEQNANRLVAALEDFGFDSLGLTPSDFLEEGVVVQLGCPPQRIDILTAVDGVQFDSCWEAAPKSRSGVTAFRSSRSTTCSPTRRLHGGPRTWPMPPPSRNYPVRMSNRRQAEQTLLDTGRRMAQQPASFAKKVLSESKAAFSSADNPAGAESPLLKALAMYSGPVGGMFTWMPSNPGGTSRAIASATTEPQSPPWDT